MEARYYFDQAATSWPKAPGVAEAMQTYLTEVGCNIGRGAYRNAADAGALVWRVREKLCALLGGARAEHLVFTPGCTHAINYVLKGLLKPGDHVVASPMEHHAVLRPLRQLEAQGVQVTWLPCTERGELELAQVEACLRADTRLVVLTHVSNVCGTVMPVAEVGALCRARGVFFCVDAAQSAGHLPIDAAAMGIDALAFSAHKGLLGPQGLGGLLLSEGMAQALEPLVAGGTGSMSESTQMPACFPDRMEAGTLNLPGIWGLNAALDWAQAQGWPQLYRRQRQLTGHLLARLREMEEDGLRVLGTLNPETQCGVVSVDFPGMDNGEAAFRLEQACGILARCGLHCAPMAHRTLGTFPGGAVRFSVSHLTAFESIDYLQAAVCQVMGV